MRRSADRPSGNEYEQLQLVLWRLKGNSPLLDPRRICAQPPLRSNNQGLLVSSRYPRYCGKYLELLRSEETHVDLFVFTDEQTAGQNPLLNRRARSNKTEKENLRSSLVSQFFP